MTWRPVSVHDRWLLFEGIRGEFPEGKLILPPELVLRELFALVLEDDEEVAGFLNDYGVVAGRYGALFELLPMRVTDPGEPPRPGMTHVLDVALYLRTARALTRHWLYWSEGERVERAWADEGLEGLVAHEEEAWQRFVTCINGGLGQYRVRVERPFTEVPEVVRGAPQAGLYSALCLQLVNHIAENIPPKRCASETCGQAFVRQLGGSVHGQHRTQGSLLYCSPACANAQWQREYRRRKRQRNGGTTK